MNTLWELVSKKNIMGAYAHTTDLPPLVRWHVHVLLAPFLYFISFIFSLYFMMNDEAATSILIRAEQGVQMMQEIA